MFRFTIRDWLWASLLVGFAVHTWIERSKTVGERVMHRQMNDALIERDQAIERMKAAEAQTARYARIMKGMQVELRRERAKQSGALLTPASSGSR